VEKTGKCFVYVLQSLRSPQRQYIGVTDDIASRLAAHNGGQSPQTARHGPWKLHIAMRFAREDLAMRFEKFLKSGAGRTFAKRHFE
jgi:predicted GIY-YIG superfamily endonuclease